MNIFRRTAEAGAGASTSDSANSTLISHHASGSTRVSLRLLSQTSEGDSSLSMAITKVVGTSGSRTSVTLAIAPKNATNLGDRSIYMVTVEPMGANNVCEGLEQTPLVEVKRITKCVSSRSPSLSLIAANCGRSKISVKLEAAVGDESAQYELTVNRQPKLSLARALGNFRRWRSNNS
ncbi:hypothetical protein [Candidatus Ichthyocystis hellenicum]|uniref:hypothetical protein n=1 Tax=Candidatus Ichthyocystis hellenicum TaxID=1561003 RepID=UPI000B8477B6|nr:hypothetical protein [Candidatus Ichthyocystis hellenicum]